MKAYDKSAVMKRAWKVLRRYPNLSWKTCMLHSWGIEKDKANDISPVVMNKILNGLRMFNRSRTVMENKPMLAGTQEHFKLLNSKTGRRIMKKPLEDDSREMLEQGILVGFDIMHQRIKESKNFVNKNVKVKNTFRNRIINLEHCVPVIIQDYV